MNFRCRAVLYSIRRAYAFHHHVLPPAVKLNVSQRACFHLYPSLRNVDEVKKDPSPERLPPISDLPHILWPSVYKTIKNFILATFIIRPYLDQDFSASEFMNGAKQALVSVSDLLSRGKFEEMNGLVTPEALQEIKERVSSMSMQQRTSLKVEDTDVYLSFPYQIGMIIYDETSGIQKRFVEVTVAYHVFRGLHTLLDSGNVPRDPMSSPEHRKNIMVCNYRFIREYTKGISDSWTINKLNHFRPADYL